MSLEWLIEIAKGIGIAVVAVVGVILWTAPSSTDFLLKLWRTWKGQRIQ